MKKMTADRLVRMYEAGHRGFSNLDLSGVWLIGEDLEWADFTRSNFTEAIINEANFTGADFTGAILNGANFTNAYLGWANFTETTLTNASLSSADLCNAIGNDKEIRNAPSSGEYKITYTKDIIQIGYEKHSYEEWENFTDEEINAMDDAALRYWKINKESIFNHIKANPAV